MIGPAKAKRKYVRRPSDAGHYQAALRERGEGARLFVYGADPGSMPIELPLVPTYGELLSLVNEKGFSETNYLWILVGHDAAASTLPVGMSRREWITRNLRMEPRKSAAVQ